MRRRSMPNPVPLCSTTEIAVGAARSRGDMHGRLSCGRVHRTHETVITGKARLRDPAITGAFAERAPVQVARQGGLLHAECGQQSCQSGCQK